MSGAVKQGVGDFLASAAFLATVVGAAIAAISFDVLWAFWLVVVASALFSLLRWALPILRRRLDDYQSLIELGRAHPQLLQAAGKLQQRLDVAVADRTALTHELQLARAAGIREGRRRAVQEFAAVMSGTRLTPIVLSVQDGALLVAAEVDAGPRPPADTLWYLKVRGIATVKAVLRVLQSDDDGGPVVLALDHALDPDFVAGLTERASRDTDFPTSLSLECRAVASIFELQEEG